MTGRPIAPGDGIYDDGEWLSWEWINDQLESEEDEDADDSCCEDDPLSREGYPYSMLEQIELFDELVELARRYRENTGRYLQIWGELGEMYAETHYYLRRHVSCQQGSDGTIDGALVEVKTISPEKKSDRVLLKRSGAFEKVLIVRIDADFEFRAKLFDRSQLKEGFGVHCKVRFPAKPDA